MCKDADRVTMNGAEGLHGVQTVFLLLLVLVAVFAMVARRLEVPYRLCW